ncbi:MAG: hypothetical protein IJ169_04470 [Paludibacteraceae bacterium]|nr:hypothetical protein [Paludibacteraceae bacterium]
MDMLSYKANSQAPDNKELLHSLGQKEVFDEAFRRLGDDTVLKSVRRIYRFMEMVPKGGVIMVENHYNNSINRALVVHIMNALCQEREAWRLGRLERAEKKLRRPLRVWEQLELCGKQFRWNDDFSGIVRYC